MSLRIENLTGEDTIVGRQPYGARPDQDRLASVGFRLDWSRRRAGPPQPRRAGPRPAMEKRGKCN